MKVEFLERFSIGPALGFTIPTPEEIINDVDDEEISTIVFIHLILFDIVLIW